ncbi:unnamed protein product [Adineta ricciae]|uniref:Uncharacterized protein n=1 Tax=Adineta ricciae TaxID=249248 RepID=A0A815UJT5_ADIRI|nr:unnamed protein product [Adineta ricciae]
MMSSPSEINTNNYGVLLYPIQQPISNFPINDPHHQWQFNYYNQHPPLTQSIPVIREPSIVIPTPSSIPISVPNEASNIPHHHTDMRNENERPVSGINLSKKPCIYIVICSCTIAQPKQSQSKVKNTTSQDSTNKKKKPLTVLRELSTEHLGAIKATFERALHEHCLPKTDHEQHMIIYNRLREIILSERPDARIILYGPSSCECCLKEENTIEIDIEFKETLPYETLKELLEIVRRSVHFKNVHLNTDCDPLSVDLSVINSNILVRLTANNTRAVRLSQIIQIYTKFDERVLPLLRLFRILAKICNTDKPDLGTFHPMVFDFLAIYFLQQLDPCVVPCLHEYVYGIEKVPFILNNDQYPDFFQKCNAYVDQWKSKNSASTELLFLQLLSFYTEKFHKKRFIVCIQTRMPVKKIARQIHNQKLFCLDPTSLSRNLCYTMKANRSFQYFQHTLKTALNYFCQQRKDVDGADIPPKELLRAIEKSYSLLIEHFPKENSYWDRVQQEDIREDYKRRFDHIEHSLHEPNDKEKVSSTNNPVEEDQSFKSELESSYGEKLLSLKDLCIDLNRTQKEILCKEYEQQVKLFNAAILQIVNNIKSITEPTTLLYDMQAQNFGARQGAPPVCTICHESDHTKSDCPELILPEMVNCPANSREWLDTLSRICQQVTGQCKPTKQDAKNRQDILNYLQTEFRKSYPSCSVHAYGSSLNGFGLRQSDLDICVLLTDNYEELDIGILEKLFQIMRSTPHVFRDVEFVRDTRVPIIRSIHSPLNIEIDVTLHNVFAMENTRLLRVYSMIDSRVPQLGYMVKHLVKICDIGDAKFGTLSSYAYIIMLIHFLQQIQPPVLPVLQQRQVWINKYGPNTLTTGELWIAFLRYYADQFDYEKHVVAIRQIEPLTRDEKGWFHRTIAIEDPFILTHNLAERLSLQKWTFIRRVFIRAKIQFSTQLNDTTIHQYKLGWIQKYLFDVNFLCPERIYKPVEKSANKNNKKAKKVEQSNKPLRPLMGIDRNLTVGIPNQSAAARSTAQ